MMMVNNNDDIFSLKNIKQLAIFKMDVKHLCCLYNFENCKRSIVQQSCFMGN